MLKISGNSCHIVPANSMKPSNIAYLRDLNMDENY